MITFRAPDGTRHSQVKADAAHLAAMMASVLDDADLYLERRATCAEGVRPLWDDGYDFSGGNEECFNERHARKQN